MNEELEVSPGQETSEEEEINWEWKKFHFENKDLVLSEDFKMLDEEEQKNLFNSVREYSKINFGEKYTRKVGSGGYGDVYDLCENPPTVVKEMRTHQGDNVFSFEKVMERYALMKKLVQEKGESWLHLPRHYGILVKANHKDENPLHDKTERGYRHGFVAMEKVDGMSLADIDNYLYRKKYKSEYNPEIEAKLKDMDIDTEEERVAESIHKLVQKKYDDFVQGSNVSWHRLPSDLDKKGNIMIRKRSTDNHELPFDVWLVDL